MNSSVVSLLLILLFFFSAERWIRTSEIEPALRAKLAFTSGKLKFSFGAFHGCFKDSVIM